MLFSRDRNLASGHSGRPLLGRPAFFLAERFALLASMFVSFAYLVLGVLNEAFDLLHTFAGKMVKPNKLKND